VFSDRTDVNAAGYGAVGDTGKLAIFDLGSQTLVRQVTITGGSSSGYAEGNKLYMSSNTGVQRVDETAGSGAVSELNAEPRLFRQLWLRLQ
jgi:hypothetical protein